MGEEVDRVLGNLVRAVGMLEGCPELSMLIPEVRSNIVYALPNPRTVRDVAGVEGRITVVNGRPKASSYPRFGASWHMARLIVEEQV
ncbi:thiamine-phosphate synthase family protein [Thermofilum pendens]|uniref:thiamine-phosphate synthase family protein n=1 Tax=Thermofilum pendens TaxID=2269 RepID=UPI00164FE77D|nr:thiamine-phosphate synthase family protein [Thermofilum pendens]